MSSYPTRSFRRTALAPGIIGTIVLLAGLPLLGTSTDFWIMWPVSVLALIVLVFAWQAKQWWWCIPMLAIAVGWNAIYPINWHHLTIWLIFQYVAAVVFLVVGVLVKVPNEDARGRRPGGQKR